MPLETCRRIVMPSISDRCHEDPPSPPDAMRRVRGSRDSAAPPRASTAAGTCSKRHPRVVVVVSMVIIACDNKQILLIADWQTFPCIYLIVHRALLADPLTTYSL